MKEPAQPHDEEIPGPQSCRVPDELRKFLEAVDHFIVGIEQGKYRLDEEQTHLVDGDYLQWSFHTGISGNGIWGCPNEERTAFEFHFSPATGSEWHLDLTRAEIAQIASGARSELVLYTCANPHCCFRSSGRFDRCPCCALEAGVDISSAGSGVRGLCPYCNKLLRSLSARQCRHCLMDWHDPAHPIRLSGQP